MSKRSDPPTANGLTALGGYLATCATTVALQWKNGRWMGSGKAECRCSGEESRRRRAQVLGDPANPISTVSPRRRVRNVQHLRNASSRSPAPVMTSLSACTRRRRAGEGWPLNYSNICWHDWHGARTYRSQRKLWAGWGGGINKHQRRTART